MGGVLCFVSWGLSHHKFSTALLKKKYGLYYGAVSRRLLVLICFETKVLLIGLNFFRKKSTNDW
jgi:hypothetical protein